MYTTTVQFCISYYSCTGNSAIILMVENEEELKNLLMRVKEKSKKSGLKLHIQKTTIMASWSHHFRANRRGKSGNSNRFLFSWAEKSLWMVTASKKLKDCLLLGRKAKTNWDSILKIRDIILLTKVHIVKAMVFPIVMYGCESWTIKKAKSWRIDAFELW